VQRYAYRKAQAQSGWHASYAQLHSDGLQHGFKAASTAMRNSALTRSNTTSTGGAISSTFIFSDTAALNSAAATAGRLCKQNRA
jgi:hypothetical protein